MTVRGLIGATSAVLIQWMAPGFAQQTGRTYRMGIVGAIELPTSILLCADRVIK
jgi:hypothetical protein